MYKFVSGWHNSVCSNPGIFLIIVRDRGWDRHLIIDSAKTYMRKCTTNIIFLMVAGHSWESAFTSPCCSTARALQILSNQFSLGWGEKRTENKKDWVIQKFASVPLQAEISTKQKFGCYCWSRWADVFSTLLIYWKSWLCHVSPKLSTCFP